MTKKEGRGPEADEAPSAESAAGHQRRDDVMTVGEVSEYLRIHKSTLYRLLKEGKIPAFRIGSDWRFNREQMDRWIANQQKPGN